MSAEAARRRLIAAPDPRIRSLVVLPVENLSGDPAQEYLADGMTDALIGDLAKIGALRVISRTSAMRYKGAKKPLPEIASELNVDAVVEGAMQRSGDRVSIRARLIHACQAERRARSECWGCVMASPGVKSKPIKRSTSCSNSTGAVM